MTERSTYSPFPLIDLALDNAKLLIGVPLAAAVFAVLLGLVTGGRYNAESSFKPQSEQGELARFSGLAAQFGIDMPGGARGESVDFYARLVRSRALLADVVRRDYDVGGEPARRASLIELYHVRGDGAAQLRKAVDKLTRNIAVDADLNAGVIAVRTRDRNGAVAEQVNRAILDEVNRFNLERRQSQAMAERRFVEAQVARSRDDLAAAEQELGAFMQSNRRYEEWPQLRFEAARLQRQVDLQQQVYTTLLQALERARLDEVRNTPVITILDHPEGSAKRARKLVQTAVLGGVLGLTLVLAFIFLRDYTNRLRSEYPEEYARVRGRRPWVAALFVLALGGCDGSTLEPVASPLAVVMVSSGADHTCALTDAGVAWCWGRGTAGELGNAALANSNVPVPVVTPLRFRTLSAGQSHTCALTADGAAYCWGWNAYFQRGNTTDTATALPVQVSGDHRFAALDAGSNHTCALEDDGTAWCWGYNRYGQLGDGTTHTQGMPVPVVSGQRFTAISAGGNHTCALGTNPAGPNIFCWGFNSVGQVGAGSDTVIATSPVRTAGTVRLDQVSAGLDHNCGLAGTALYCWGGNAHGQLADGTSFPEGLPGATSPVPSPTRAEFLAVAAGAYGSCGIATDGRAWCWGRGGHGQLGNGNTTDHFFPQAVALQPRGSFAGDLLTFRTLSPGNRHVCGSTGENVVYCWGSGDVGQLGRRAYHSALLPLRVTLVE
jgi:alpha-tubulin suppressor-like RCC1 family protein/capsule polysaccharide export protein KpsE/RkpR